MAAGFDKNAVALPAWEALGFGFAEAGTVTVKSRAARETPRPSCRAIFIGIFLPSELAGMLVQRERGVNAGKATRRGTRLFATLAPVRAVS
jgi:dihydroorotate dehydrogenase